MCFWDIDDRLCFLIGISETEHFRRHMDQQQISLDEDANNDTTVEPADMQLASQGNAAQEACSSGMPDTELSSDEITPLRGNDLSVVIDAMDMDIIKTDLEFARLYSNTLTGQYILQFIAAEQRKDFRCWVQEFTNTCLGTRNIFRSSSPFPVTFVFGRNGRPLNPVLVKGSCVISCKPTGSSDPFDITKLRLNLDIRLRRSSGSRACFAMRHPDEGGLVPDERL